MIKKISFSLLFQTMLFVAFAQQSNINEDYSAYLPEVRGFNKILRNAPKGESILTKEGLAKARDGWKPFLNAPTVLKPTLKKIHGPAGDISLYIYKPDTVLGVVLDIHGGGWCNGTALVDGQMNDAMARACHVAVVSVDYRLAPENPFPACIEDCKAAARWLINSVQAEFGTDKIFLSGNSAGAHLASVTTLFIRDSLHAINKVKGVNLVYGLYDLGSTPSHRFASDTTFLTQKDMADMMQLVFGNWSMERLQKPQYSPLYADLHNLPPALFTIGAADPLADDTYFMEARWRVAGNKTFLAVYPESGHGLDIFPTKMAKLAREKMHQWLIEQLKK